MGVELVDPDAVLARHPRQPHRERTEVGDRDVDPAPAAQRDGHDRRFRDEGCREPAVVVGHHDVLHRTVGHQPPDLAEVAGGRVPPRHDDLDLPGDLLDLLEDVRAEQHGAPLAAHPAQQGHEVQPLARVDAVERLVEQEHRRVVHQRRGELDPLAHALGVGADPARGGLAHLDDVEGPLGGGAGVVEAVQLGVGEHELAPGEVAEAQLALGHQPDGAVGVGVPPDRLAVEGDRAGRRGEEAGHQGDDRGLAGAVRAEQAGHAGAHRHRDPVDGDDVAVPARGLVEAEHAHAVATRR